MQSKEAARQFINGYRCSEAILKVYGEQLGLDHDTAMKMGCILGGGVGSSGDICGAITSSILVLGLKYGRTDISDKEAIKTTNEVTKKFIEAFKSKYKCIKCNDLVGFDRSTEQGHNLAAKSGVFKKLCPQIVEDAALILEELL